MAFRILALTGGGYLGFYTASVLAELERRIGGPLAEKFDLLAGTSVGGIIALALAAGIPAATIHDLFIKDGSNVFSSRPPKGLWTLLWRSYRSMFRPEYDGRALRATLDALIGPHRRMGDLTHRIVIPAVDLTDSQPRLFRGGNLPGAEGDAAISVVDVAMATSAAPTYFPAVEIAGRLHVDGGLHASMPDLLALETAVRELGVAEDDIRLLSVGTTSARFSFAQRHHPDLGSLAWTREERFVRTLLAAQQGWMHDMLTHRLGAHYLRIDRPQTMVQQSETGLHIAPPRATGILQNMADESVSAAFRDARLAAILGLEAAENEGNPQE